MSFWYYAFWYLMIGVLIDVGLSKRTKPALWSIFLWPVVLIFCLFAIVIAWIGGRD